MLVPLRVSGHYPLSAMALNIAALTEIAVLALCVTQSQSFVLLAAVLAGLRCLTAVAIGAIAYRHAPEVFVAPAVSLRPTLRQLLRPSLAFIILPVVYTLNLQGYTLLVGFAFGATAVAGFVAIRVVVRAIDLVMTVVYSVQFFEAGYIEGDKQAIQRRQLATMTTLTTVAIAVFACVLMLAGDWLLALFTAGKGAFDPGLAFTLLAAGALRGLATTPQSMVAAESAHGALARSYLLASLLALGAATALATAGLPLLVIVAMLIPAELVATVQAFRTVLTRLDWNVRDFLRALGSRERLADVVHLARFLGATQLIAACDLPPEGSFCAGRVRLPAPRLLPRLNGDMHRLRPARCGEPVPPGHHLFGLPRLHLRDPTAVCPVLRIRSRLQGV